MTVAMVLPDLPWPPVSGGHLRHWQQLQLLKALGHRVTALAFVPEGRPAVPDALRALGEVADEVETIPCGARVSNRWAAKARRHLITAWPWHPGRLARAGYLKGCYPLAWPYDAADGGEQVAAWARRHRPAAVLLPVRLLHYLPLLKSVGVPVVVDAPDLHSRNVWETCRAAPWGWPKVGLAVSATALRRLEGRYLAQADEIWVTSPPEAAAMRRLTRGRPPVVVVPNLVDPARYRPEPIGTEAVVLFVGVFGLPANADAAGRLLTTIFPRVRRRCPTARLRLVGAGLPPRWQAAARRLGAVEVTGEVPDVRPSLEAAAVVAIPLRVVGGVPYKLMEAMASAKAIVATSKAVAGVAARPGEHLLVADTPARFAAGPWTVLEERAALRRLRVARARA